jgi:hypothetical protein
LRLGSIGSLQYRVRIDREPIYPPGHRGVACGSLKQAAMELLTYARTKKNAFASAEATRQFVRNTGFGR